MAQRNKLSGAALAAELSDLPYPQGAQSQVAAPVAVPVTDTPPAPGPNGLTDHPTSRTGSEGRQTNKAPSRGGRPAKAGVDGIPLNVRLSQSDHLALAKLAGKLMVPGRPLPTVQDVVRGLIRGALKQPDLALKLSSRDD